jgi:hypothetical protein
MLFGLFLQRVHESASKILPLDPTVSSNLVLQQFGAAVLQCCCAAVLLCCSERHNISEGGVQGILKDLGEEHSACLEFVAKNMVRSMCYR